MMKVENDVSQVETIDSMALLKKQTREIKALKQELLMHDSLADRHGQNYDPFTPEQTQSVIQSIEKYIESEDNDEELLGITSVRQMHEICKQFKILLTTARQDVIAIQNDLVSLSNGDAARSYTSFADDETTHSRQRSNRGGTDAYVASKAVTIGVPDISSQRGFALGLAAPDSRPAFSKTEPFPANPKLSARGPNSARGNLFSSASLPVLSRTEGTFPELGTIEEATPGDNINRKLTRQDSALGSSNNMSPQNILFDAFSKSEGLDKYSEYLTHKQSLKDNKVKLKELIARLNGAKHRIDALNGDIEARKQYRISQQPPAPSTIANKTLASSRSVQSEEVDVVDEEEFRLLKELQETKLTYKNAFAQYQRAKEAVATSQSHVDTLKLDLADAFVQWSGAPSMQFLSIHEPDEDTGAAPQSSPSAKMRRSYSEPTGVRDSVAIARQQQELEDQMYMASNPESVAFFDAQKTRRLLLAQNNNSIKLLRKIKRLR